MKQRKRHRRSIGAIFVTAFCMVVMIFVVAPEESFADGIPLPYYAKASSQNSGQITLTLYEDWAAHTNMGTWRLQPMEFWQDGLIAIYQKAGNGSYRRIKLVKARAKTYTVKNLKKNVKYSFKATPYFKGFSDLNKNYLEITVSTTAVTKDSTKFKNVSRIKLSKKSMTINYGKSKKLTATLSPVGTKVNKAVKWYVAEGDNGMLKVNQKGKVTALSTGTGYVYAVAHNGVVAKCKVTVKNPQKKSRVSHIKSCQTV